MAGRAPVVAVAKGLMGGLLCIDAGLGGAGIESFGSCCRRIGKGEQGGCVAHNAGSEIAVAARVCRSL